ncbi:phage terminase small subunit [Hydrogenispora ethanolica]|jgi:phage terminase small subunit|uniref:Phage terminase small subunit n=1 Tax=Hydrogenispora ethanolica TaxID=1082276 RepID=A0A4R1S4M1_HYDET|nr:terminase small subunit [Hydrogenispora ethanolica]TCL74225.1 phage terminase small subunit [Hydrogenispora ethanolica]
MGRIAKYDWDELLKEYLKSSYSNKTEFAKAKGINPSLLRRNTTDWPEKVKGKSNVTPLKKVTQKGNSNSNVTQKVVTPKITVNDSEELTEKQRLFCLFYIRNFNATQAAIKAGYSSDTARQIGCELLTKPHVRAEVERLKEIKRQSIMLAEDDIVERYMRIAFADMTDFVEFGRIKVPVIGQFGPVQVKNPETGKKETLMQEVNDIRFKDFSVVDGGLICQVKQGRDGASIKLEDRQKALDWLANFFNMNPLNKHKQWYDQERLKIQQEQLKLAQRKAGDEEGDEPVDDGFIDALNSEASSVWSDYDEDED